MTIYDKNLALIRTLDPDVQFPTSQFTKDAFDLNKRFSIVSARRTQADQDWLFLQGRETEQDFRNDYTKGDITYADMQAGIAMLRKHGPVPGNRVTWTRNSLHVHGLAIDIKPENCTYADLDQIAKRYGLYRVQALIKKGDMGHYNLDKAKIPPFDTFAARRKAERLADRSGEPRRSRIKKRLTSSPS